MRKKAKDTRMQRLTRWMVERYFPGMAIYKQVIRKKQRELNVRVRQKKQVTHFVTGLTHTPGGSNANQG